jgi:hypothetical protein
VLHQSGAHSSCRRGSGGLSAEPARRVRDRLFDRWYQAAGTEIGESEDCASWSNWLGRWFPELPPVIRIWEALFAFGSIDPMRFAGWNALAFRRTDEGFEASDREVQRARTYGASRHFALADLGKPGPILLARPSKRLSVSKIIS